MYLLIEKVLLEGISCSSLYVTLGHIHSSYQVRFVGVTCSPPRVCRVHPVALVQRIICHARESLTADGWPARTDWYRWPGQQLFTTRLFVQYMARCTVSCYPDIRYLPVTIHRTKRRKHARCGPPSFHSWNRFDLISITIIVIILIITTVTLRVAVFGVLTIKDYSPK